MKQGTLPEVVSKHLLKLIAETGGADGPIGKQFIVPKKRLCGDGGLSPDPLLEEEYEVAPGLVYKYRGGASGLKHARENGRVLWTVTRFCASYCRFCTRGRLVGAPIGEDFLSEKNVRAVFSFLKKHPEVNEVLVSGGDPLTLPRRKLEEILTGLAKIKSVKIVRLGTRLPVSNPDAVMPWHYEILKKVPTLYLMLHVNHPAELTVKTLDVLRRMRTEAFAVVCSQSVLLKGVNDSADVLAELFNKLAENSVRPYYLIQNDPVPWARNFTVPIKKAVKLWQNVRPRLSGIAASAKFVIDTPRQDCKIPVPDVDFTSYEAIL